MLYEKELGDAMPGCLPSQGANPAKGAHWIHAAPQKKRGCESRNPLI